LTSATRTARGGTEPSTDRVRGRARVTAVGSAAAGQAAAVPDHRYAVRRGHAVCTLYGVLGCAVQRRDHTDPRSMREARRPQPMMVLVSGCATLAVLPAWVPSSVKYDPVYESNPSVIALWFFLPSLSVSRASGWRTCWRSTKSRTMLLPRSSVWTSGLSNSSTTPGPATPAERLAASRLRVPALWYVLQARGALLTSCAAPRSTRSFDRLGGYRRGRTSGYAARQMRAGGRRNPTRRYHGLRAQSSSRRSCRTT
jgi:hypothetical protein